MLIAVTYFKILMAKRFICVDLFFYLIALFFMKQLELQKYVFNLLPYIHHHPTLPPLIY